MVALVMMMLMLMIPRMIGPKPRPRDALILKNWPIVTLVYVCSCAMTEGRRSRSLLLKAATQLLAQIR